MHTPAIVRYFSKAVVFYDVCNYKEHTDIKRNGSKLFLSILDEVAAEN